MSESKENGAGRNTNHDPETEHDSLLDQDDVNDAAQAQHNAPEGAGLPGDEDVQELTQEQWGAVLTETQEKVAKYHDELLRAKAEVENIRRRAQEDVSKARKFAIETFAESLVPVVDSLEAALGQPDQDANAWQAGVDATLRQLVGAFERNAMVAVAPEAGDRFDPHLHQAISTVASDQPEGAVVQLLQKGYTIAERVLRPALVIVSAGQNQ